MFTVICKSLVSSRTVKCLTCPIRITHCTCHVTNTGFWLVRTYFQRFYKWQATCKSQYLLFSGCSWEEVERSFEDDTGYWKYSVKCEEPWCGTRTRVLKGLVSGDTVFCLFCNNLCLYGAVTKKSKALTSSISTHIRIYHSVASWRL